MAKPLGNSVVVKEPWIETRGDIATVGIRKVIPTKTVAGEITSSFASVKRRVEEVAPRRLGQPFFRFHSISMGTTYDIEIGYLLVGELTNAPVCCWGAFRKERMHVCATLERIVATRGTRRS